MIFVTVGEQLPFDRLVRSVDEWAGVSKKDVFAQIGRTEWRPSNIRYSYFLNPTEFKEKLAAADVIVSHAGMGTIISAIDLGKPLLVMPRQVSYNEVRNDHQFATAIRFGDLGYVEVAFNEDDLKLKLDNLSGIMLTPKKIFATGASPLLINTIRNFIEKGGGQG